MCDNLAKISIIGSGYTGSLIGKGLAKYGNEVVFYDIDWKKIADLTKEGYSASLEPKTIETTDITFICVPTPTKNGRIDLNYIKSAAEVIGNIIKNKPSYHLIVIKSTVVPTTTENFIIPLIEKSSGKKCGVHFGICVNPEFLTQVNKTTTDPELKKWYESNPNGIKNFEDRVVIGEYDKKTGDMLEGLYKNLNIPIFRTNLRTAEMIKYAHNTVLSSRISFWNEIFLICNEFGIDSKKVAEIVSTDSRIGKYGTVHGKAFGGTCLPKDLEAFLTFAKENGINPKIIGAVFEINNYMSEKYGTRQ